LPIDHKELVFVQKIKRCRNCRTVLYIIRGICSASYYLNNSPCSSDGHAFFSRR